MLFNSGKKQFLAGWRGVSLFYTHLQRGTRIVVVVVGCLVLLTGIYLLQGLFNEKKASADLAKFYPAKCLGGWQYTAHAENVPDLSPVASIDDFNDINSAVLDNAMAQMYCSGFNGENPIGTVPKKLTLRLSLGVKSKIIVEAPIDAEAASPVMTEEPVVDGGSGSTSTENPGSETPTTDQAPAEPTVDASEPAPVDALPSVPVEAPVTEAPAAAPVETQAAPAPEPAVAPSAEPTSWLPESLLDEMVAWLVVGPARAEELGSSTPGVMTGADEVVEASEVTESVPSAGETELSSSTDSGAEASSTVPIEEALVEEVVAGPVMPADALLEVSYTLDGQTWKNLGWVAESAWREASFELPLEGISDWSNLDWLQVRFDRVATLNDNQPIFYLDGMWLEGEYDVLETDETAVELDIDQPDLKKDKILKQKISEEFVVINVIREKTDKQELWYRLASKGSARSGEYWKKVQIESDLGEPTLLDSRSDMVFWLSESAGKKMLCRYDLKSGASHMMDVNTGGLSSMGFDEEAADGSGMQLIYLYFVDDNNSYYFSK